MFRYKSELSRTRALLQSTKSRIWNANAMQAYLRVSLIYSIFNVVCLDSVAQMETKLIKILSMYAKVINLITRSQSYVIFRRTALFLQKLQQLLPRSSSTISHAKKLQQNLRASFIRPILDQMNVFRFCVSNGNQLNG